MTTTTTNDSDNYNHQSSSAAVPVALKAVIFDIDGTLADSWKLGFDATNEVLQKNGISVIDEETYHYGCRFTTPNRLARHAGLEPFESAENDDTTTTYESLGAKLAMEFDDLYIDLVSPQTAGFYPGMGDLLLALKEDVALGCLTNAAVGYGHAVLRENDCHDKFASIRGADNVPKAKPHPDGLWQVCKDLSLEPTDCIYIGDSPSDGTAALAAGMLFIGVTWGSNSKQVLAKVAQVDNNNNNLSSSSNRENQVFLCDTMEELKDVLARFSVFKD
eukprot:CAMPEP_0198139642 /NCGR_PEP_ID=MMETSP1443-20131203/2919_1 /TAXON_ID=186043 /ORGANISM="Entomoneis sp., Strain CCMP2396" /LENGTH=274 /DNA_ID=CAMNT_0043801831 /DNA_START=287 /DNA_END=1111 /DNA_ORIENTATION=-